MGTRGGHRRRVTSFRPTAATRLDDGSVRGRWVVGGGWEVGGGAQRGHRWRVTSLRSMTALLEAGVRWVVGGTYRRGGERVEPRQVRGRTASCEDDRQTAQQHQPHTSYPPNSRATSYRLPAYRGSGRWRGRRRAWCCRAGRAAARGSRAGPAWPGGRRTTPACPVIIEHTGRGGERGWMRRSGLQKVVWE